MQLDLSDGSSPNIIGINETLCSSCDLYSATFLFGITCILKAQVCGKKLRPTRIREFHMVKKALSFLMLAILLGIGTQAFAQDKNKNDDFKIISKEEFKITDLDRQCQLARDLVSFGYKQKSAIALVQAAEILAEHPITIPELKDEKGKPIADVTEHSYDPKDLLKDAKEFAQGSSDLLAYIGTVEKNVDKTMSTKAETTSAGYVSTVYLRSGESTTVTYENVGGLFEDFIAYAESYNKLMIEVWTTGVPPTEYKGSATGYNPKVYFSKPTKVNPLHIKVTNLESSSTRVEVGVY